MLRRNSTTAGPVRLGLLAASPVYYNLPLYRAVASDPRLDFTALFASSGGVRPYDSGYGRTFEWDVDALAGYRSQFLKRADRNPISGGFFSLHDWDVVGELLRRQFEVLWIFGYNFLTHMLALATQRARGGEVVFREEQTLLHPRSLPKTLAKEIALRVILNGRSALYIGSENRRWFEHYGVPATKQFFSPYAVDNDKLQSEAQRLRPHRRALRRELGLADTASPVILSVSRLIRKKQPEFLLEAFRRVRSQRECSLLIVGLGELEPVLRDKVAAEGIPDVVFAGFLNQSQVADAYACADIFALLSREHETFGLVTNEAMNFSLPVVVTRSVGCATDLVSDGLNGYLVSATNVDEACQALTRLVDSADLRTRMGAESLERIIPWNGVRAAEGVVDAVSYLVGPQRWAEASATASSSAQALAGVGPT